MRQIFTSLFFIAAAFCQPALLKAQNVSVADSIVLVNLYDSTGGINWTNNAGWLAGPVKNWYGISLDGNGRVVQINLFGNNLSGNIPYTLGNLANLGYLGLNNNQLSGSIPASLGNLSQLGQLQLFSNQLSGTIPPSLGNLANIGVIALNDNQLTGIIPSSFANLTNLSNLNLSNNKLSGAIPSHSGSFPKLTVLFLNSNQLSGTVPAQLATLKNVQYINLSYNNLTFSGMEQFAKAYAGNLGTAYSPQGKIPVYYNANTNKLYVSVGGTPSNNTYNWYYGGTFLVAVHGDSTYTPTATGNYSVTVTNSIATALTLYSNTFTVSSIKGKSNLTASAIRITPASSCGNGSDGSFTISKGGGIAPYTYYIINSNGMVVTQASNVFTGLSAGIYSAGVVDGVGDSAKLPGTVAITRARTLSATALPSPASACSSPSNGRVHATVTGGISPFWFSLTGPGAGGATVTQEDGPTFANLNPGTYSIGITDNAGCKVSVINIMVTQLPAMQVKALATNAKSCGNGNDGQINIDRTGGAGPFEYSVAKQGGATITQVNNNLFTGLGVGVYTASVKDNAGCTATATPVNVNFSPLSLQTSITANASCNYNNNLNLNVYVTGGAAPYTYALSSIYSDAIIAKQTSSIFKNLNGAPYNVVVTDHNGCGDTIKNFVMPEGPHPSVKDTSSKAPSCIAASDGSITAAITGGKAPYTFYLEDKNFNLLKEAVGDTVTFPGLAAGSYIVSASDAATCGTGYSHFTLAASNPCTTGNSLKTAPAKEDYPAFAVQALPNPSKATFTLVVTSAKNDAVELTVADMYGRTVHHAQDVGNGQYTFGQTFAAGMYIARVMQGGVVKTVKLIKQ